MPRIAATTSECGAGRPGRYELALSSSAQHRVEQLLALARESAGELELDFATGSMRIGHVLFGAKDSVALPQVAVSFHTHPWTCPGRGGGQCFVDTPSPADLAAVIKCSLRAPRTLAHVVFASGQGCYLLAVPRERLSQFPAAGHRVVAACERLFATIADKEAFAEGERRLFRQAWVRCLCEHGLIAQHFPSAADLRLHVHAT